MAATVPIPDMQALLLGPGLKPPAGVLPNFLDPYSYKDYVVLTLVLCLAVSTLLVVIRMYARSMIAKNFGLEDCRYRLC